MSLRDQAPGGFPRVLLPPADGFSPGFLFGVKYALDAVKTMQSIPQSLIPRHGFSYAPPKFNFGWPIESHPEIFEALESTHPELIVKAMVHDPIEHPSEEGIDPEATMERVHQYMVDELQLSSAWRPRFEHKHPTSTLSGLDCFTITNTYGNGVHQPPEEVAQAMKDIFKLEGQPRWFLDFHHGIWQERWIFANEDGEIEVMT
ncbi:hypothetical protein BDZ89DRAFT_1113750 [Hymenopellis radicata]|nr:hypothetical protein BDZ89DRAFT_1113750 [Hymenopellis radicata]